MPAKLVYEKEKEVGKVFLYINRNNQERKRKE